MDIFIEGYFANTYTSLGSVCRCVFVGVCVIPKKVVPLFACFVLFGMASATATISKLRVYVLTNCLAWWPRE